MKHEEDEQRTEASSEDTRRRVEDAALPRGDRQWASDRASDGEVLQLFE